MCEVPDVVTLVRLGLGRPPPLLDAVGDQVQLPKLVTRRQREWFGELAQLGEPLLGFGDPLQLGLLGTVLDGCSSALARFLLLVFSG